MNWFSDFAQWIGSSEAFPTIFNTVVLIVAVIVSALMAARIARGSANKLIEQREFETKAAAITTLVDAAQQASVWNSLSPGEQILSDRASGQAETLIRMLPIKGSDVAADWCALQLSELKRASASYGYEIEPAVIEFRTRLLEWLKNPGRARRGFSNDISQWTTAAAAVAASPAAEVLEAQETWVAEQHHQKYEPVAVAEEPKVVTTPIATAPAYEPEQTPPPVSAVSSEQHMANTPFSGFGSEEPADKPRSSSSFDDLIAPDDKDGY